MGPLDLTDQVSEDQQRQLAVLAQQYTPVHKPVLCIPNSLPPLPPMTVSVGEARAWARPQLPGAVLAAQLQALHCHGGAAALAPANLLPPSP